MIERKIHTPSISNNMYMKGKGKTTNQLSIDTAIINLRRCVCMYI
jgi:hypothetical protein